MKAKMQKAQFVTGQGKALTSETSNSLVGKTSARVMQGHSVPLQDTVNDKKISNIVMGSSSYNSGMPTENQASFQRPSSDFNTAHNSGNNL